jgi:hypothetical protein
MIRITALMIASVAVALAAPASAEVVSRSADAFTLRFSVGVETTSEGVVTAVSELPAWWDPAHTYSGQGANLSLTFEDGGCWCERLADGTVFQHAVVTVPAYFDEVRRKATMDAASKAESGRPGDGIALSLRVDCLLALGRRWLR